MHPSLWIQPAVSLMLIHCWAARAWHENTKSGKSTLEASRTVALALAVDAGNSLPLPPWDDLGAGYTMGIERLKYCSEENTGSESSGAATWGHRASREKNPLPSEPSSLVSELPGSRAYRF